MPRQAQRPSNVFIFRIGQLGDTLVALPAIHRIAERHPDARLWLITNGPAQPHAVTAWDVLKHTGLFHGVLFYSRRDARSLLRLVLRARLARGSWLYYLSPPRGSAELRRDRLFFRGVCGFRRIEAMPAPSEVTPRDELGRLRVLPRETERLLRSVEPEAGGALGLATRTLSPTAPLLTPPPSAAGKADALLASFGDRPLVALGPGSKMPAKRWFLQRYIEVCRRSVSAQPELGLVVLGGAEDAAAGDELVRALGSEHVRNLAGRTDVIESAAVLARCSLYLGNDTGTMHLAASMGVPCVALFTSRENRETWYPWGEHNSVLRRELACSGCMLESCEAQRMRCLDLISVDDVWDALAPRLPAVARPRDRPQPRDAAGDSSGR